MRVNPQPQRYARARGKLGQLVRDGAPQEVIDKQRLELREAVAENYIARLVDELPPLTEVQRARLATLLLTGPRREAEAA